MPIEHAAASGMCRLRTHDEERIPTGASVRTAWSGFRASDRSAGRELPALVEEPVQEPVREVAELRFHPPARRSTDPHRATIESPSRRSSPLRESRPALASWIGGLRASAWRVALRGAHRTWPRPDEPLSPTARSRARSNQRDAPARRRWNRSAAWANPHHHRGRVELDFVSRALRWRSRAAEGDVLDRGGEGHHSGGAPSYSAPSERSGRGSYARTPGAEPSDRSPLSRSP